MTLTWDTKIQGRVAELAEDAKWYADDNYDHFLGNRHWLACFEQKFAELIIQEYKTTKREWIGLTDEDIRSICDENHIMLGAYAVDFMKAIEAKLKEKNAGVTGDK
jgi:hypothetical protein